MKPDAAPRDREKAEQLLKLRAASPMRAKKPQDSLVGLGLFETKLL